MRSYKKVYFIVDANQEIGYGHFKRCQLLSKEFEIQDVITEFWFHNSVASVVKSTNMYCVFADKFELTNNLIRKFINPNSLIIIDTDDPFFYSLSFQNTLINEDLHFMYVTIKNVPYKCHYLFNQNLMALEEDYKVEDYTTTFLGPQYFVLEDKLSNIKPISTNQSTKRNLLISFGSADPNNTTKKILDLMPEFESKFDTIKIVVGSLNKGFSQIKKHKSLVAYNSKVSLHYDVKNMYSLMAESNIAITSMGLTFWELVLHKIPCLVISCSLREKAQSIYYSNHNYCHLVGHFDDQHSTQWGLKIKKLSTKLLNEDLHCKINVNGKTALVNSILYNLHLRLAKESDYTFFYKIRSEKQNMFWTGYDKVPDYDIFLKWFKSRLKDPKRDIYMAVNSKDEIVGYLNFDLYEDHAAIGYAIHSKHQGKGLATLGLRQLITLAQTKTKNLIAWVSEKNFSSQKVLLKNDFSRTRSFEWRTKKDGKKTKYILYKFSLDSNNSSKVKTNA